jgi:hypothetical protein
MPVVQFRPPGCALKGKKGAVHAALRVDANLGVNRLMAHKCY